MDTNRQLEIYRWLCSRSISALSGEELLAGFCERLERGRIPLVRSAVAFASLDPLVEALGYRWTRKEGAPGQEAFARPLAPGAYGEDWVNSPFNALLNSRRTVLRRRLDTDGVEQEFPIFEDLRALGATDYIALKTMFKRPGAGQGMMSSWATDQPGGFTDAQIQTLHVLMPGLQLAFEAMALSNGIETLLGTYLGRDVSRRVLAGAIERGVAHALDAVLWASDLAGFTRLTDTQPQEQVIDLLNAYAERVADTIEGAGGEVLKFTGDGMIAFFDRERHVSAPARALQAATRALAETRTLSERRAAQGLPVSRLRVALHSGLLFYGNIGSRSRLDFTVVGPAANEATRLCEMCKSVDRDLVVSAAFHDAAPGLQEQLVGLGRYALRGVARAQRLYTLDDL